MARNITKICLTTAALLLCYVLVGAFLSNYVFPPGRVDLSSYFRPGDRVISQREGFDQTVLRVSDGWLHTRLVALPHAEVPPEHFHEAFTETFSVKSGTLSIMVDGEKRTVHAGESLTVPPMTNHKPFNETDEPVVVESTDTRSVPVEFGFLLTQLYGFMDERPGRLNTLDVLMQLCVYGPEADSYIAGPPLIVQGGMRFVMAPTARLLGYRNYYPQYAPQRAS